MSPGGRSVAKILVADDNSNIQKMVVLALKDQGIDVLTVGNGEAAVRKISDVRPDLVLADVFMPVRNGYEVCQYVKANSKLAHIPVILLVGAFDPLDEQEAQRVGADGVLKKPFVPPDPLISMVKSALTRAGVPTLPEPQAVSPNLPSPSPAKRPASAQRGEALPAPELGSIPFAGKASESFSDTASRHPKPLTIPETARPLAFGSLLEAPVAESNKKEEETDPAAFLVPRHPKLEEERAWNAPHTHTEEETSQEIEEEELPPSWRRDAGDEALGESEPTREDMTDWRASVIESVRELKQRAAVPPADLSEEAPVSETAMPQVEAQQGTGVPAGEPADDEWKRAFSSDQSVPVPSAKNEAASLKETADAEAEADSAASVASQTSAPYAAESSPQAETASPAWFSSPASPWDPETQKASQMESLWVGQGEYASSPQAAVTAEEPTSRASAPITDERPEGTKQFSASQTPPAPEVHAASKSIPAEPAAQGESNVDAVVAKVLEKISSDMLQVMTRELLKPVVEEIVRGEFDAKK